MSTAPLATRELAPEDERHRREVYAEKAAVYGLFQRYDQGLCTFAEFLGGMQQLDMDLSPSFFRLVRRGMPDFSFPQLMRSLLLANAAVEREGPAGHHTEHGIKGITGHAAAGKRRVSHRAPGLAGRRPSTAAASHGPPPEGVRAARGEAPVHFHAQKKMFGLKQRKEHRHLILAPQAAARPGTAEALDEGSPPPPPGPHREELTRAVLVDLLSDRLPLERCVEALERLHGGRKATPHLVGVLRRRVESDEGSFRDLHRAVRQWAQARPATAPRGGRRPEGRRDGGGGGDDDDRLSDLADAAESRPARSRTHYKNASHVQLGSAARRRASVAAAAPYAWEAGGACDEFGVDSMAGRGRRAASPRTGAPLRSEGVGAALGPPGSAPEAQERPRSGIRRRAARSTQIYWSEAEASRAAVERPRTGGRRRATQPEVALYRTHSQAGLAGPYGYGGSGNEYATAAADAAAAAAAAPAARDDGYAEEDARSFRSRSSLDTAPTEAAAGGGEGDGEEFDAESVTEAAASSAAASASDGTALSLMSASEAGEAQQPQRRRRGIRMVHARDASVRAPFGTTPTGASRGAALPSGPAGAADPVAADCVRLLEDLTGDRCGVLRGQFGRTRPGTDLSLEGAPATFDPRGALVGDGSAPAAVVTARGLRVLQRRLRNGRRGYVLDTPHCVCREVFPLRAGDLEHLFVFDEGGRVVPVLPVGREGTPRAAAAPRRRQSVVNRAVPWGSALNEGDRTFFQPHH